MTKDGKVKMIKSLTTNLGSQSKSIFYKERIKMNSKIRKTKEIKNKSRLQLKNISNQITNQNEDQYTNLQPNGKVILEGQIVNQKDISLGFIRLGEQNNE